MTHQKSDTPQSNKQATPELQKVLGDALENKFTETKPDKFIRLAEQRTNKAINQIHALGDLSNTAIYDYTPEQVTKIKAAITNALQLAVDRLNGLEPKQFKL